MCDKITMEVVSEFKSVQDAMRKTGYSYSTIQNGCRHHSVGYFPYVFRYADDYDPEERFNDRVVGRPVVMLDIKTGKTKVFPRASEAAKAAYISKDMVYLMIKTGGAASGRYVFDWAR